MMSGFGGLNEKGPYRLIYLDSIYLLNCLGKIRGCGLVGGGVP